MGASSRAFTIADAPNVDKIDCDTDGNYGEFEGVPGDKHTIECPPKCSFSI